MHSAIVLNSVEWSHKITTGQFFLEDHNAAELLWASRCLGDVKITALDPPAFDRADLWKPGTRVLFVRVGGFGDLLWLAPIYERMRSSGISVAHSCFPRYKPVLDGFIDEWVPYPLNACDVARFDALVWLENSIEGKACTEHPAKRLAALLGAPNGLQNAGYLLKPYEVEEAKTAWPRTGKKRVCVQVGSSGSLKDYPHMPELLAAIAESGAEILLVGDPRGEKEQTPNGVFDCTQQRMTIRASIAMASQCDAIVAPDSIFVHVGGALGIPVVGLFGPFSGRAYMEGYIGAAMQGRKKCSPCSWHPRGTPFPPGGPCAQSGECTALANIPPEDVVFQLKQLLK